MAPSAQSRGIIGKIALLKKKKNDIIAIKGGGVTMSRNHDLMLQNLKIIKIMKSCGHTDSEIANTIGVSLADFLYELETDSYIKEVYEKAQDKLATDIETAFLDNVMKQLEKGKTEDAKWILERTNKKYTKKEQVDLNVKTIDDIIREQ